MDLPLIPAINLAGRTEGQSGLQKAEYLPSISLHRHQDL